MNRERLRLVDSLWSHDHLREAVPILEEMVRSECMPETDDLAAKLLYRLGCGYALLGETDTSITLLRRLASLGRLNCMDLAEDEDLDHLRDDPRFTELLNETTRHQMPWQRLFHSSPVFELFNPNLPCELKIAGLSTLWSEVKYNFVYFDRLPGLDWDSLYLASLPQVCATKSTFEYYQLLRRIGAQLRDGHTMVSIPEELNDTLLYFPGIRTRLVGDTVVVTDVYDPTLLEQGMLPGAEIVMIDGLSVHDYAARYVMPYQNSSTYQDLLVRTYEYFLLAGPCASPVTIGLVNGKQSVTIRQLDRDWSFDDLNAMQRDAEYRIIDGNIGYLTLNTFHDEYLTEVVAHHLASIKRSDALIIDLRENYGGYTTVALNTLKLFMERSFQTHRWETPRYKPSQRAEGKLLEWHNEPAEVWPGTGADAYRKPIVLLTSASTYSAAEHFLVPFRYAKRGAIIGERSGGSTGHTLNVPLPGGGAVIICTTRDYFPDGSAYNGIGIEPDVVIKPTVDDLRSGRDPVLRTAIEYLNRLLGRESIAAAPTPVARLVFSIEIGSTGRPLAHPLGSRRGSRPDRRYSDYPYPYEDK
jgi:C-terminal processing protease CtpA/Prc